MKIITNITTFFSKNKKNFIYAGITCFFLFASPNVFAADTTTAQDMVNLINEFFKIIAVLLTLGTNLIGWFLSPEWITGSILGIDVTLKHIWILVSNIVYFLFAGILIAIAIMNILGKGDQWELKAAIPRFIVGIFMVPFSWFFVNFMISLASILTATILSLPVNDFKDDIGTSKQIDVCNSDGYQIITGSSWAMNVANTPENNIYSSTGTVIKCKGKKVSTTIQDYLVGNKIYSILYIYTYHIMKLENYAELQEGDVAGGITSIVNVIFKLGFSGIFLIAYSLLLIALGLALFTRVMWMWLYMMFSPLFGLMHFFSKSSNEMTKKFNIKEFIGLCLVPTYVSAALVFGFLFISVASTNLDKKNIITQEKNDGCIQILDNKFCWAGVFSAENAQSVNSTADQVGKAFMGFKGNIGQLLLQLFGIAFLWMAVMAALKSSTVTSSVVEPIAGFGKSIGDLITKMPQYAPIIPTPGGMMSATGLQSAGSSFSSSVSNEFSSKGSTLGQSAAKQFGFGDELLNKFDSLIHKTYNSSDEIQKGMKDGLQTIELDRFNEVSVRNKIGDLFTKFGADANLITKIKGAKDIDQFAQILQESKEYSSPEAKNAANALFNSKTISGVKGMIGSTGGKSGTDSNTSSPIDSKPDITPNVVNGIEVTRTIKIGSTAIILNKDGTLQDNKYKDDLVNHLVNQDTIGTMTKPELTEWLTKKIGLESKTVQAVEAAVEAAVKKLKKDGKDITNVKDFYKKEETK